MRSVLILIFSIALTTLFTNCNRQLLNLKEDNKLKYEQKFFAQVKPSQLIDKPISNKSNEGEEVKKELKNRNELEQSQNRYKITRLTQIKSQKFIHKPASIPTTFQEYANRKRVTALPGGLEWLLVFLLLLFFYSSPLILGIFIFHNWIVGLLLSILAGIGFNLVFRGINFWRSENKKKAILFLLLGVLILLCVIITPQIFFNNLVSSIILLLIDLIITGILLVTYNLQKKKMQSS